MVINDEVVTLSRTQAALSHLLLSVFVFSAIFSVFILYWYPTPYFSASGGWQGLKIAALVDLVLGPLLTFIVVKKGKSLVKIKFDIVVILFVQLSALLAGVHTIYQQRPLAVVLWEESFYTVPAIVFEDQEDKMVLQQFGQQFPIYAWVEKPIDTRNLKALRDDVVKLNKPPYHLIERYKSIIGNKVELERVRLDIVELMAQSAIMAEKVNAVLNKTNKAVSDYIFIPLKSKYRNIILIFNKKGELVDNIVVPPTQ